MRFAKLLLIIIHCPLSIIHCSAFAQDYNDPSKVLEIMDKSKMAYKVMLEEDFQAQPPLRGENNTPFTYQQLTDDGPAIATYEMDSAVQALYEDAEKAFAAQDYALARSIYLAIHERKPEIGIVVTYIGQTYESENNPTEAIHWLKKAIDINFHDYMAHWFLASNYFRTKQYTEAAEEIAIAWVLNRNHEGIREAAAPIFKGAGLKFDNFEFLPQYSLSQKDEDIEIRFSEDWMMYAFCKALWQYEPGYHRELGGGRSDFDMNQEKECLLNLAMAYERLHRGKKGKNPAINAVLRALEQKQVNAFIFMEIWLPQEPLIVYTQPKEAVQELATYVLEIRGKRN